MSLDIWGSKIKEQEKADKEKRYAEGVRLMKDRNKEQREEREQIERETLEKEKKEWKERVSLNSNQQNIVRTHSGSTNRGTEPSQDASHTLPFKPQRQPNGANYLYSMIRKYKTDHSTGEISIMVMKDITKQWQEYHLNELSNIVGALGYEFKFGKELTDWKKRMVKIKIKFGRNTLYLLPVKKTP